MRSSALQESYVPSRIPILLEKLLRVRAANENILIELYYGYTRICDFKSQQRVANMLYKDYEQTKYLLWGSASVIMQVRPCNKQYFIAGGKLITLSLQAVTTPALAEKICYPLAQKMLEKAIVGRKPTRAGEYARARTPQSSCALRLQKRA